MSQKQKIAVVIVAVALAVAFAILYGQFSAQAPTTGTSKESVRTDSVGNAPAQKADAGPVSVDAVVDGLAAEALQDDSAFQEEVGTSALDDESDALNDITQSYDENEL
jgi:hypothetical protein